MNNALTIVLQKNELAKIMKRIAKCDKRLDHGIIGIVGHESELERKQRLLIRVTEIMTSLSTLGKEKEGMKE